MNTALYAATAALMLIMLSINLIRVRRQDGFAIRPLKHDDRKPTS